MSALTVVLILWGIVTAALAGVMIFRSLMTMKEDDQLFLSAGQATQEQEQRKIQRRIEQLTPYAKALGASSGVLLMAGAGLWIAQEFGRRNLP